VTDPAILYKNVLDKNDELRHRFTKIAGDGKVYAALSPSGRDGKTLILVGGSRNRSGRNVPAATVQGITAAYRSLLRAQRQMEEAMAVGGHS
jgi:hypothetical protein